MASVRKRAAGGDVLPGVNETSNGGTAGIGTVDNDRMKSGGDEAQARKPSLAEFGWDFPFNSPKPIR
jgi:hypothetical protein